MFHKYEYGLINLNILMKILQNPNEVTEEEIRNSTLFSGRADAEFNNEELSQIAIWCEKCIYYTPETKECIALKLKEVPSSFFCAYGNNGAMVD